MIDRTDDLDDELSAATATGARERVRACAG